MFNVDPTKDLERKIYQDMNQLKHDISISVKQYIDSRTSLLQNPQVLISEIEQKFIEQVKTNFMLEAENHLTPIIQEEIKKEMCRITLERETYEEEHEHEGVDRQSDSLIRRETLVNDLKHTPPGLHDQMIIEEGSKENEDTFTHGSDKENNDPSRSQSFIRDQFEVIEESDVEDDLNNFSPPNKIPNSFVESKGSILPSDISSSKRETINIFENSDKNEASEINRSFNYNPSDNSSMKKMKYNRNVSQKYFDTSGNKKLNESNILRERLTDPNNISNNRSNESITISHKTFNHSNVDSEKIRMGNLKGQSVILVQSGIDLEKK